MRFSHYISGATCILLLLIGCKSTQQNDNTIPMTSFSLQAPPRAEVTILHINDVYEIAPLEGGKIGGMARVASLRQELMQQTEKVITVLAGDFLNPSVIGTVKHNDERISGAQMVDVMNATGVDYVGFGNHEFDLKEKDLQKRINESDFEWISSNTFQKGTKWIAPFEKVKDGRNTPIQPYKIIELPTTSGKAVRMGIISVCLPANKKAYVNYHDILEDAKLTYGYISDKCDFVIGLTHLSIEQDRQLARAIPQLALIMGGHEHQNHQETVGSVVIAKADANAKTAYVHKITYDATRARVMTDSYLRDLDETIALDEGVTQVVNKWEEIALKGFKDAGFDINRVVTTLSEPLDGREVINRFQPASMGIAVAEAIFKQKTGADASLINSGAIRIDDVLSDTIREYDIIRMLPFGGAVYHVEMTGKLLAEILDPGLGINKGSGGYLQVYNITHEGNTFQVNGQDINMQQKYTIALPAFLMTGREKNLGFLTDQQEAISKIVKPTANDIYRDIRLVMIDYLKQN